MGFVLSKECPVNNPSTNHANAAAPMENTMSPGTRIQRSVCIEPDCMNSADLAYHVPCSMDAQACNSPTGNMLRTDHEDQAKIQ